MITKKRVEGILGYWGLEGEKVTDIYYEGTGNRNESAYYIGEDYVLKFTANLGKLKSHIAISKALEEVGRIACCTPSLPSADRRIGFHRFVT